MTLAEQISLTAAFVFLMTGLLTGIWKYRHIARSADATAPTYVDIAHRASLMYSFAAVVLAQLASVSAFSDLTNTLAASAALLFFALAIMTYIVHGALRDTDNQLRRPHKLGSANLPGALIGLFMWLLIIAEVGGVLVLGLGAMVTFWGA